MSPSPTSNKMPATMIYRRFGQTNKQLSIFTLGCMRFTYGWNRPYDYLPEESLNHCQQTLQNAMDAGINLLETARAYGKSERLIGQTLKNNPQLKDHFLLMTKLRPAPATQTRQWLEESLERLQSDHIHFLAIHGLNVEEDFQQTFHPEGTYKALYQAKEEGLIGHIGFSTHGNAAIINRCLKTQQFEFLNLHYYYFRPELQPMVKQAAMQDMGILIISPNDKGGQLYQSPAKLQQKTKPLSPVVFNERWLINQPEVHTLSIGLSEPDHIQIHQESINQQPIFGETEKKVDQTLKQTLQSTPLKDCATHCQRCLPCPEKIHIPELLRLQQLADCFDLKKYGQYRYSFMDKESTWSPSNEGSKCTYCNDCLSRCPMNLDIPTRLLGSHKTLWSIKRPLFKFFSQLNNRFSDRVWRYLTPVLIRLQKLFS
ncbi:aldo/keto reductase [Magnetococcales bacterium HHB-1]